MTSLHILLIYILSLNFISLIVFSIDKKLSIANMKRVPEKYLFLISFLSILPIGSLIAMLITRHKIKKISFIIVLSFISIINIVTIFLTQDYWKDLI